jgi:hypothetical protein
MRIKLLGAALVTALATWLVFVAASGATSSKPAAKTAVTTFHLVEVSQSFHYVDNPPLGGQQAPPSAGDQFVFVSRLVTKSGKQAGMLYVTCTEVTGGKNAVGQCTGNFALAGGDLVGSAVVRGQGGGPTSIAIVGGTKAYAGIRGSVLSVPEGKDGNRSADTFTLFR